MEDCPSALESVVLDGAGMSPSEGNRPESQPVASADSLPVEEIESEQCHKAASIIQRAWRRMSVG